VHVYFTLERSPVEANSVVVICIVGVSLAGCVVVDIAADRLICRRAYPLMASSRLAKYRQ